MANIVFGQIIDRIDLAGVAHADRHAEIAQLGRLASRHEALQGLDGVHGLGASGDLALRQSVRIGPVEIDVH